MTTTKCSGEPCGLKAQVLSKSATPGSLLQRLRVSCPRTGEVRTGVECSDCEHFVGWTLSPVDGARHLMCRLPCSVCGERAEANSLATTVVCRACAERADAE